MAQAKKQYESDQHWLVENTIADLVGATIIQPVLTPVDEFGDQFAGFKVRLPNGESRIVFILRDPEGNGGGFLEVQA